MVCKVDESADTLGASQEPNPLQLGEVLFEVLDATVIALPKGASSPQYNRVGFSTAGSSILDQSVLSLSEPILDFRACPDLLTSTTPVFVLTDASVSMIGAAGAGNAQTWQIGPPGCSNIVGLDPTQTQQRTLLLLGQTSDSGVFLLPLPCMPEAAAPTALPLGGLTGSAVGGLLVRQQRSAHVIVAMLNGSKLQVYDLGAGALGPTPSVPTSPPVVIAGSAMEGTVAFASGTFLAGADQQIAVTFLDADSNIHLVVLGWGSDAQLKVLATWTSSSGSTPTSGPAISALAMEGPLLRIAAGDLVAAGTDQIVVGFPATFQGIAGCAALLLFQVSGTATPSLTFASSYAGARADGVPFASIDMHLLAGLFGESLKDPISAKPHGVLGLLVVGCGASPRQLFHGNAVVAAGLVTVSQADVVFPLLEDAPGVPQFLSRIMTVGADTTSIIALASDVTGQSVILGPPALSQTSGQRGQMIAILQAPPFEKKNSASQPQLTVTEGKSQVDGYSVSANQTWMFSDDTGTTTGIGPATLSQTLNSVYGHGFSKVKDTSTATSLQVSNTEELNDLIVLYAIAYDIWIYPVYRKASQSTPDGSLAVVFPQTGSPTWTTITASDSSIGFEPRSQIGTLLSYKDVPLSGFDSGNLIFEQVTYPVDDDSGGSTLTYDQSDMITLNAGTSWNVQNSASSSTHFGLSANLFSYVPVSFGLNITNGTSYSDDQVQTTSTSFTTSFSISIQSGSVPDIEFGYLVTPLVYQHTKLGCLVVAYNVSLDGKGWENYYSQIAMPIMLTSLIPNTQNSLLAQFSRDITFEDQADGTVNVKITMLNNSLAEVEDIVCELFLGLPGADGNPPAGPPIDKGLLPTLGGAERGVLTLKATLTENSEVTVAVFTAAAATEPAVYWGIYPPSAFVTWEPPPGRVHPASADGSSFPR